MASDADIESITSEEFSYREGSYSSNSTQLLEFLVFDCDTISDSITPGKIVKRRTGNRSHELVQRDLILSLKSYCNVVSHEQFLNVFGTAHECFLTDIHSVVISLPPTHKKTDIVTFFISKEFSNTPSPVCQNTTISDSQVPFYCRIFPKAVHIDNIAFMKRQLSSELIHLCHQFEDGETTEKVNFYNITTSPAYYLNVVKYKTNILKFIYHQSYETSVTYHVEYQSTDTFSQVLWNYHRLAKKNITELSDLEIYDLSLTDDYGKRIDQSYKAIISLLVNERKLISDNNIFHSYPAFLVHLTPRVFTFWMLHVRILGDDRGHMHPFTVFIRNDSSTNEFRQEIAKHCHWKPQSFEIFPPNGINKIEEVENLQLISTFQFNPTSVFTVRRISKVTIVLSSDIERLNNAIIEEYPTCSIEELKNEISTKYEISTKEFDLMYRGTVLEEYVLLEEFTDRKASFELSYNQNRLVFRLYVHKGVANRSKLIFRGKFLHIKVDDPEENIEEVIKIVSEILQIKDDELYLIHGGHCLERSESYINSSVTDRSIVCMCHCPKPYEEDEHFNQYAIFQANTDGTIEKGGTPSVAALQLQLKRLRMKDKRSRSTVTILNIDLERKSGSGFHRMASVPNKSSRNSLVVNEPIDSGYKSDSDLLSMPNTNGPKPSPSDSRLYTHYPQDMIDSIVPISTTQPHHGRPNLPLLDINTRESKQMPYYVVTPPPGTELRIADNMLTSANQPSSGYKVTLWGHGNIPDLHTIFCTSPGRISDGSEQTQDSNWNRLFLRIAKEITPQWKNVGRYLNISNSNINIIDQNNQQIEQKSYSMLVKWREINGQNATKSLLVKALIDEELRTVAEIVEEFDLGEYE